MKIGQPFYRINQNYLLSTFNEHKFSVLFILGIEKNSENNVVLECTAADLTVTESLTSNRANNGYYLGLEYDAEAFSKLNDNEQNQVLFEQFGFVANPEDLRTQFNNQVETEIIKERDRIQQWAEKLDEIEESITEPTETFEAGVVNTDPIYVGDTVEFFSKYFGTDVTNESTFYVNSSNLGPIGSNTYVPATPGTYNGSVIYNYNSTDYTFEVLPTP